MNRKTFLSLAIAALLTVGFFAAFGVQPTYSQPLSLADETVSMSAATGTGVSYQGVLREDDLLVTGSRAMTFTLFTDSACRHPDRPGDGHGGCLQRRLPGRDGLRHRPLQRPGAVAPGAGGGHHLARLHGHHARALRPGPGPRRGNQQRCGHFGLPGHQQQDR